MISHTHRPPAPPPAVLRAALSNLIGDKTETTMTRNEFLAKMPQGFHDRWHAPELRAVGNQLGVRVSADLNLGTAHLFRVKPDPGAPGPPTPPAPRPAPGAALAPAPAPVIVAPAPEPVHDPQRVADAAVRLQSMLASRKPPVKIFISSAVRLAMIRAGSGGERPDDEQISWLAMIHQQEQAAKGENVSFDSAIAAVTKQFAA